MSYWGLKRQKSHIRTYAHMYTHIHTSGRQLKIIFLDVLDYSDEYSDTNISNFFFHETASSVRKQNRKYLRLFNQKE